MNLVKFSMPFQNSCTKCGQMIGAGKPVFAVNANAVVSGNGLCAKCAGRQSASDAPAQPAQAVPVSYVPPEAEQVEAPEVEPVQAEPPVKAKRKK